MIALTIIYSGDLGELNRDEITKKITERGPKWRLPTVEELLVAFQNKVSGFLSEMYFGTDDEAEEAARDQAIIAVDMKDGWVQILHATSEEEYQQTRHRVCLVTTQAVDIGENVVETSI